MRARYLAVVPGMLLAGILLAGFIRPPLRSPSIPLDGRSSPAAPVIHSLTGSQHRVLGSSGCLVCHGDPTIAETGGVEGLYITPEALDHSVHASFTCTDCHRSLEGTVHTNPEADLAWAVASCGRCHREQVRDLQKSVHGPEGPPPDGEESPLPAESPTCVTCHGGHDVPIARSRTFVAAVARTCSSCHLERGESYFERNYHGKESALGRYDVAACADCHGAHSVLPRNDPRSSVNPANVLDTCRNCHITASGNFGDVVIHVTGRPLPTEPKLRTITLAMTLLLVGTFGAFGTHTILAIRHAWRRRRRGAGSEGDPR